MRLIDLQIDGFGKLNNERIVFSEGTNLITGPNEAGKSTVYTCIRAMFFGMTRARGVAALTDTYSRFRPWLSGRYGAALRVEDNGHIYCIRRDFFKDPVGCSVYDETLMEAVPYADRFVAELLLNMSADTFDNTISISKLKADRDAGLGRELKKYIVNMDSTGSHALNCTRARAYLNDQKRKLTESIDPEAAKAYALNCGEIKRLEKNIREYDAVTVVMPADAGNAEADAVNTAGAAGAAAAVAAAAQGGYVSADTRENMSDVSAVTATAEDSNVPAAGPEGKSAVADVTEEAEAARAAAEAARSAAADTAEAVRAAQAEAAASAETARAAKAELAALQTDIQCLDAEIIAIREKLRGNGIFSGRQAEEEKDRFAAEISEYNAKSGGKSIRVFRVLYIICFVLVVLDIFATAFAAGSNYTNVVVGGCLAIGAILLVLAIAFLVLCIIAKKNYAARSREFGRVLERYTGFNEVSQERIERVREKLDDLMRAAKDVEGKEISLAELSLKVREKETGIKQAEARAAEAAKRAEAAAERQRRAVSEAEAAESAIRDQSKAEAEREAAAARQAGERVAEAKKAAMPAATDEMAAVSTVTSAGASGGYATPQSHSMELNETINTINGLKAKNLALKAILRKNDAINEEIDAVDMALEKIDELADTMKDSLGVHLNARASEYIREITGGAYDSLSVDDELNVFMNTKDRMVPIEQVSNGTSDQIYMALRLAGARLVQNGEDRLPLIFDDSFVNYDDERLAATLSWLVKEYRGQVIMFSCQSREEDLLKENGLTFNSIHL